MDSFKLNDIAYDWVTMCMEGKDGNVATMSLDVFECLLWIYSFIVR